MNDDITNVASLNFTQIPFIYVLFNIFIDFHRGHPIPYYNSSKITKKPILYIFLYYKLFQHKRVFLNI